MASFPKDRCRYANLYRKREKVLADVSVCVCVTVCAEGGTMETRRKRIHTSNLSKGRYSTGL